MQVDYKPYQHAGVVIAMRDLGCRYLKTTEDKMYFEIGKDLDKEQLKRMSEAIHALLGLRTMVRYI